MLKKLLASVLAVATVASCALVPSALTSAATTYETADLLDYQIWQLNNPAATEEKLDVTVYYAGNYSPVQNNVEYIYKTDADAIKVAENNAETVLAKILKRHEELKKVAPEMTVYDVTVSTTAAANIYIAQVIESKAVVYSEYNTAAAATADTKAETLAKADMKLLGYYPTNTDANVILKDMYATGAVARLADKEFAYWSLTNNVIVPVYKNTISTGSYYYTAVELYRAGIVNKVWEADKVVSGIYYKENASVGKETVLLPNNDQANWDIYIRNYTKVAAGEAFTWEITVAGTPSNVTYSPYAFKLVEANKYAMIYTPKAATATEKEVDYKLSFWTKDKAGDTRVLGYYNATKKAAESVFTTDLDEIYAIMKEAKVFDKGTVAEFLEKDKKANGYYYALTGEVRYVDVNRVVGQESVQLQVFVERVDKYTVYSFAEGDVVKETEAWLRASQTATTNYSNVDGNGHLTTDNTVIKATAAELGVATEATIKGVPAEYAYAKVGNGWVINCTYKMGDATVNMQDFATTVGEFDDEAYFGRAAVAGDVVTLKVSLSELGDAKKLDWKKISVYYDVAGDATVAEKSVEFSGSELYKDGIATDITLAAGTNIVTAVVTYDGKAIGVFAPFYAYVAE